VIDTLRQDHLSFFGYHDATSPGLDRLAHCCRGSTLSNMERCAGGRSQRR